MESITFTFHTVDGRNPANQLICSLSHYLQDFIHLRRCRISSINSSSLQGCIEHVFMPLFGKDDATAISKGPSLSICQTIVVLFRRFVCAREFSGESPKLSKWLV